MSRRGLWKFYERDKKKCGRVAIVWFRFDVARLELVSSFNFLSYKAMAIEITEYNRRYVKSRFAYTKEKYVKIRMHKKIFPDKSQNKKRTNKPLGRVYKPSNLINRRISFSHP